MNCVSVEILHITVGQLRAIPEEIRKKYVTAWLRLNERLSGDTTVDVTPTSVTIISNRKPLTCVVEHDTEEDC